MPDFPPGTPMWVDLGSPDVDASISFYGELFDWNASDPVADGRIKHFRNARLASIEKAGHWSHHDQLDVFMEQVEGFLSA